MINSGPGKEPTPDPEVVYDDDLCEGRTGGLTHIKEDDGRCPFCARVCYHRKAKPAPSSPARPVSRQKSPTIPRYLMSEYFEACRAGLEDSIAQATVALKHGLTQATPLDGDPTPPSGVTRPTSLWTLKELARLEFVKHLYDEGKLQS